MDKNGMPNKIRWYRDSNLYTERFYIENLRRMGGEKRLGIAFGLYEIALNLCKSSIIESDPGISDFEPKKEAVEKVWL
jgi:hypothetical protein